MTVTRLAALVLLAASTTVAAQVPLSKEPHHRVTFENSRLRILNVSIAPGESTLDHRHELDIVTVSMTGGTETRVQAPGGPWTPRPARPLGDAVITEYAGKPQSHVIETVGKSVYQLLAIENLQTGGWSTATSNVGPAIKPTTESRAFRVYDVKLARESSQTTHTHAVPTIAVLIAGAAMSDGPDAQAKANAPAPVGLKQLTQAGQWLLIPAGDTHHLVRLGTADARIVEIEVR